MRAIRFTVFAAAFAFPCLAQSPQGNLPPLALAAYRQLARQFNRVDGNLIFVLTRGAGLTSAPNTPSIRWAVDRGKHEDTD